MKVWDCAEIELATLDLQSDSLLTAPRGLVFNVFNGKQDVIANVLFLQRKYKKKLSFVFIKKIPTNAILKLVTFASSQGSNGLHICAVLSSPERVRIKSADEGFCKTLAFYVTYVGSCTGMLK